MRQLLAAHEPAPVIVERTHGRSQIVLSCDHAGKRIPGHLEQLGLPEAELERHIAWDIGALGVARRLSELLDAALVAQRYSRLVIDCNRPTDHHALIPPLSEATVIPGNEDLDAVQIARRRDEIFDPYHSALIGVLDSRVQATFVAIHSFTPVYLDENRPWHLGILYGSDRRMADSLFSSFADQQDLCIGDNEPYQIDAKDYGIPIHGEARGIPHVLLEIRQDLIATESGQRKWGERLAEPLAAAAAAVIP